MCVILTKRSDEEMIDDFVRVCDCLIKINTVCLWYVYVIFRPPEKDVKRQWCSGNMEPFQGSAGGSIPP